MSGPLLKTKFYIPPARPELVSRPRLIEQLNAGLYRKLTLVSAPAGFGKTTLLSEWCRGAVTAPLQVAWLTLDKADNDPARFLAYVIAALQTVEPSIGQSTLGVLRSSQPPPAEMLITALINEIAILDTSFVLVLDDYYTITLPTIHNAMVFLLDHLPPQMHLAIATRADPPLPLPRLRIRDELTELRVADLRFGTDEIAAFFNETIRLGISPEDVAALEARTEGWIAGLQVAALSLKGHKDTDSFIRDFTGGNRYIMDYLVEEVLQQQSESIQTFLLQTAILDRLTGALCDVVTGQDGGQATLEALERTNLFIVPLDDERRWYRYHRLFADLLRARLKQTQPDWVPELHRRAAEWCGKNGLMAEAIDHALAAGDFEQAARLVEQVAPQTLWRHGEVTTFLSWLNALPEELIRTRPRLGLYHAWALLTIVRLDGVEERLQDVERALSETEGQALLGEVTVIRAMMANFRGDRSRAIELCNGALEIIPQDNLFLRTTILGNLGGAYAESGDVVAAGRAFAEASRLSLASGNHFAALIALCFLADTQATQGQLHQAAHTYRRALELVAEQGGGQLSLAGLAYVGLGDLLREWNDLDGATRQLVKGIELGEQQGDVIVGPGLQILMDGYLGLAQVCHAQGNADGALEAIRKAEQVAYKHNPSQVSRVTAVQARLWVAQGNLTAATRWIEECGLGVEDEPSHLREFEHLTLVRVLIAQGRSVAALGVLGRLLQAAKAAKRTKREIEILALKALSLQAQGEIARALTVLEQALALAEPEGYVRTFVDEGAPMKKLVRRASARGIAPEYAKKLLTAFGVSFHPRPVITQPLIDPLSGRELEVLRLVADGLSNREIAEELVIAVTTVKKHVSNILGKLGVSSRTQAVARFRELDLM